MTQYGEEPVEKYKTLKQKLKMLQTNKDGFVRLTVDPFIEDRRYLETIYDTKKKNFYTCVLEDRNGGQGFWEYRSERIPMKKFKRLFRKHRFDFFTMVHMAPKPIGIQRSVVAPGKQEKIYMMPFEIENEVFNSAGKYGGAQGSPRNVEEDSEEGMKLYQIIEKYYPYYGTEQKRAFLEKLNSEGCGYVAIVNLIFEHFLGREEEFERTFGMPMYTLDGELNYDMLLTDFYAATDNHIYKDGGDYFDYEEDRSEEDEDEEYDYTLDTTGWGTTFKTRNYRTHLYLKDKGFDFEITNYQYVTLENVRELCQHGRIEISLMNGNIQNEDGSTYEYCEGHVMIITGVTRDCRYIVSTWGKKMYVDPNEVVEKDGKRTELYYKFLEVENRHIHV